MRQLTGLDASFLNIESGRTPMHLTSLLIFDPSTADGGAVSFEQIMAAIASRITLVPTFRERLAHVPLGLGYPWWVDDGTFDVEFHVRQVALPAPGDWRQLCVQVARIAGRPLDMSRPLWEMTVIEGLGAVDGCAPGCFAIILKTHHSAVDGASGMQILSILQELSPDAIPPVAQPWTPERMPSGMHLTMSALATLSRQPITALRLLRQSVPAVGRLASGLIGQQLSLPENLGRAPETRFGGRVSPHRVFDGIRIDLDDLRLLRRAAPGATINDVVLGVVGGAMRAYLRSHEELPEESLVAMVPLSVRGDDATPNAGNRVSAMIVPLRTDVDDPIERIAEIHGATTKSKALTAAIGANLLTQYAIDMPAAVASLGTRLATRAGVTNQSRRLFNTTVTNVPGPQVPTYFCGAHLLAHYGIGPLQDGLGIFHSLMSADGSLFLSMTACRAMVPDPGHYAACLRQSLDAGLASLATSRR